MKYGKIADRTLRVENFEHLYIVIHTSKVPKIIETVFSRLVGIVILRQLLFSILGFLKKLATAVENRFDKALEESRCIIYYWNSVCESLRP